MTDVERLSAIEARLSRIEDFSVDVCEAIVELTTADLMAVQAGWGNDEALDEIKKTHARIHEIAQAFIQKRLDHEA